MRGQPCFKPKLAGNIYTLAMLTIRQFCFISFISRKTTHECNC